MVCSTLLKNVVHVIFMCTIVHVYFSDLRPKAAASMVPGLPAFILFMMIRYTDYINNEEYVRSLIQGAITMVKKVVKKKGPNDVEIKALWLSNVLKLLHCLKEFSGDVMQSQDFSDSRRNDRCLRNFDLSEYRRVLSDVAIWIYQVRLPFCFPFLYQVLHNHKLLQLNPKLSPP